MPRQPGVKRAQQRVETKEKILDATEKLLSTQGLRNVTVKDVAKDVGVHPALIHYYFENKQALIDATIDRRADVVNEVRMAAFDAYLKETGGKPTVEGAVEVFVNPVLEFMLAGGPGWRNHGSLIAQISMAPDWGGEVMRQHYDRTTRRFLEILKMALPELTQEDLVWGFTFTVGALMSNLSRSGRVSSLSDGAVDPDDFPAIKARMAAFLAAGFDQLAARRRAADPLSRIKAVANSR